MKTASVLLIVAVITSVAPVTNVAAQTFSESVARVSQPVFATSPPGDAHRLFVVGKTGTVSGVDLNTNQILDDPFLRIRGLNTSGEQGLLGMAFHPDYVTNGKFYVYASLSGGLQDHQSHVMEYKVMGDPATSNIVDLDSKKEVMIFDQPFGNHNGGWIGFDPTAKVDERSYLYIATGDGGSGGDPRNNAQDITNNFLGKMLRIDIDGDDFASDTQNYAIPPTNPFVDEEGDDEIVAYGLRNPWRSSFDRATGDLWMGDVGQGVREEISVLPQGEVGLNFGWRVMEGNRCFDRSQANANPPCDDPSLVGPVYEYNHGSGTTQGNSVTGGYVYHGSAKEFQGHYFFADFTSDNIWTIDPYASSVTAIRRNAELRNEDNSDPSIGSIASFAEDNAAELYILDIGGEVFKVGSNSRDSVWVGSDPNSGSPGDAQTWAQNENWMRAGTPDVGFVSGDHLILSGDGALNIPTARMSAMTIAKDMSVTGTALITSGNVFVDENVTARSMAVLVPSPRSDATGEAALQSENSIRKLGSGTLEVVLDAMPQELTYRHAVLEGTLTFIQATNESRGPDVIIDGGILEQPASQTSVSLGDIVVARDGVVRLFPSMVSDLMNVATGAQMRTTSITRAGSLEVNLPADFAFPVQRGERIWLPLNNAARRQGEFNSVTVRDNALGHQGEGRFLWLDTIETTSVVTAYNAYPGDADGNGRVEFADFLRLTESFGLAGDWTVGDFNGDMQVSFPDFLVLSANFGVTTAAVPEPTSLWLPILVTSIGSLTLRRRSGSGRMR